MQDITVPATRESGFTLIELSIVLVIIGLLVGGVLAGQSLIKAAQIQSTISQIDEYNTAVNTFHTKYNGLPGDLASPTTFFSAITNSGGTGQGDGNGVIDSVSAANTLCATTTCISGEAALFWYELSQANLIQNPITTVDMTNVALVPSDSVVPAAKYGKGSRIAVQGLNGTNYFVIGNFGTAALASGTATFTPALLPADAFSLDTKLDDGVPNTGSVISITPSTALVGTFGTNVHAANGIVAGDCATSDTHVYAAALGNNGGTNDSPGCTLGIKGSF